MTRSIEALDRMVDAVLAYKPKSRTRKRKKKTVARPVQKSDAKGRATIRSPIMPA